MRNKKLSSTFLFSLALGLTTFSANAQNVDSTLTSAKDSTKDLDEVIVTGYGKGVKASLRVGNVATISGKVLENKPTPNLMDNIAGRVAGLQVYTSSGEPSQTSSFRINGPGGLGAGSTPMIVVDGVMQDASILNQLNPNDIETFNVLRDASATAIYGARAANGVIVINTRKGSIKHTAFTVSGSLTTNKLLGTTKKFYNQFMNTSELLALWKQPGWFEEDDINKMLNYPNAGTNVNTQWYKQYYRNSSPLRTLNASASGGGGKTTYFMSGGLMTDQGLAFRSGYNRYNFRSNINTELTSWMSMGMNMYVAYTKTQTNPYGSNSTNRGLLFLAQPFYSPTDPSTGTAYNYIPGWNRYSPQYLASNIIDNSNTTQANPNAYIQIKPIKGLILKSMAGLSAYDTRETAKTLPSFQGANGNGSTAEYFYRNVRRNWQNTAEYSFDLNSKHNFDFLAGHEWIDNDYTNFSGSSNGQSDDRLTLLGAGSKNIAVASGESKYAYLSFFGQGSYNYDQRYFLTASLRRDKSSRFGRNLKGATFYSIGGMWKISQEKFMKNVSWVDDLSLRASYGTTGNSDIDNYENLPLVGTNTYDSQTGWSIGSAGNPNLSWEKTKETMITLDGTFFDSRLKANLIFWNKNIGNMLMDVPYPYTSGFAYITSNVGTIQNRGYDATVSYDVIKTKDFTLTPHFNFEYFTSKVLSLFQGKSSWVIPNTAVAYIVGKPVSYMYPIWAGVNSQTGAPQWYLPGDDNSVTQKDPTKVTSDFSSDALQQNTGIKRYAPFYGGFGLDASYKGFSFTTQFQFISGKYMIANDDYFAQNANAFAGFNTKKDNADYWKEAGDNARFPSLDYQFTQFDSRLIQNASFIRMKNITLSYTLPKSVLAKTHVFKNAQFYVAGRNLLTITPFSGGPDPEVDANLSLGQNPNTKQYSVGANLQF